MVAADNEPRPGGPDLRASAASRHAPCAACMRTTLPAHGYDRLLLPPRMLLTAAEPVLHGGVGVLW